MVPVGIREVQVSGRAGGLRRKDPGGGGCGQPFLGAGTGQSERDRKAHPPGDRWKASSAGGYEGEHGGHRRLRPRAPAGGGEWHPRTALHPQRFHARHPPGARPPRTGHWTACEGSIPPRVGGARRRRRVRGGLETDRPAPEVLLGDGAHHAPRSRLRRFQGDPRTLGLAYTPAGETLSRLYSWALEQGLVGPPTNAART